MCWGGVPSAHTLAGCSCSSGCLWSPKQNKMKVDYGIKPRPRLLYTLNKRMSALTKGQWHAFWNEVCIGLRHICLSQQWQVVTSLLTQKQHWYNAVWVQIDILCLYCSKLQHFSFRFGKWTALKKHFWALHATQSFLQWPFIHPFSHTITPQWVAAAREGAARPIGSN